MGDPKKIQESEDLSLLLENAFVSVHLVGKDGTILWANNAELVSLGYTFDEFVDHSITEFHADQKVISDILHKLSDGDTLIDYPAQLVCKNGQIRDVLINSNVYWVDGEFVHTRCFTRDITERKRAEAKLLESNQRLGKTLEELQASTEEIALVDGVAQIITSTLDIDEVYEKFAEAMNKLVAFNKATINTVDWESRTYTLKYHFGPEQPNRPLGTVTPLGGFTGCACHCLRQDNNAGRSLEGVSVSIGRDSQKHGVAF